MRTIAMNDVSYSNDMVLLAVEACPNGMIMTDPNGTIVLVNAEVERLFGYTRAELLGSSIDMLVPPVIKAGHHEHRARFAAQPETRRMGAGRDLYGARKDGAQIPIEIGLNPIRTREGTMVLSSVVDISERKKVMQALAEQREELQRSNADLEQFAYVVSHDLREPLRMVATYSELLAERYENKLDDSADQYIHYVIDGAKRMQQLVRDLLAYSRIRSQAIVAEMIDAGAVVRIALDNLRVAIAESHAEVACDPLPSIRADESQLGQVFQNLIGNALKFRAERPPRIHIGAHPRNGKCEFHVEDNGIGLEKQYEERVFQMFQRLHERGRYEGNGIGLAITKKIVERHGGRIWFESEVGKGTTFFFTMPSA
jgi:PAS domain S-box-containing protein